MLELLAGFFLAVGAVFFILKPILWPRLEAGGKREAGNGIRETGHGEEGEGEGEGEDPEDDLSPRAVALRALKEIEFDRATGKLSDADYDALKRRYTTEALATLRAENTGEGKGETGNVAAVPPFPVSRFPFPACAVHGSRPESHAQFCSECGRRLGSAPGYCARCGTSLEQEARYCHSCGARVAA